MRRSVLSPRVGVSRIPGRRARTAGAGLLTGVAVLVSLVCTAVPASAEQVGRDVGFGGDGVVAIDFNGELDVARPMVVQPDGKVVIGGFATIDGEREGVVVRLSPDGSPDAGFGDGGIDFVAF